jgi:hypothetical protein
MGATLGLLARSSWVFLLRLRFILMNFPALLLPDPPVPSVPDTKTMGEEVAVYRHSLRTARDEDAARIDFSTMLRVPDTRPPRFVLCVDRYANYGVDVPAEHCEVQFTGILHEQRQRITLHCAYVSLSDALDENCNQKFYPCSWELGGTRNWDGSVTLDLGSVRGVSADILPEWLFDEDVPLTLQR